jgi:hypothetical protein
VLRLDICGSLLDSEANVVSVKVCFKDSGKPAKGKNVAIGVDSFFSGGVTNGEWTDADGEVHFDIDPCQGKIFVDGQTVYKGSISGQKLVYV